MEDRAMGIDWGKSEIKISSGDQEVGSAAGVTVKIESEFNSFHKNAFSRFPKEGTLKMAGLSPHFKELMNKRRLAQLAHQAHLMKKFSR